MNFFPQLGSMPRYLTALLAVATGLPVLTLLLPLCIGVWLPDMWSGPTTVAQAQTSSRHQFRVVQKWGTDFYTTELVYVLPDGTERRGLIDGDANKWWNARLAIDESAQCITVNKNRYKWPERDRMVLMPLSIN